MATGLGALGDDEVDTGVDMAFGVLRLAGERTRLHPQLVATVDHVLRGWAECVDDQRRSVGERDLEIGVLRLGRHRCRRVASTSSDTPAALVVGECRHAVALEDVVDVGLVLGGDQVANLADVEAALVGTGVLRRHDQIDTEGAVTDLVLDPLEIDLELLWRMGNCAEHTETTRFGDGGNDVAAVSEREDRNVDPEHVGHRGLHEITSS